jgi:methylmalonyl-CoA mutase N-terminal domain/subunit
MKNKFESLDNTFNVDTEIISDNVEIIPKSENKIEKIESDDIKKDYEYTRGNLYSIIEKGQEALNSALELAVDGGQPRAYEVVGQLIKNVSDATDKLLDLQKKLKDIDETKVSKGPTSVTNNALFIGSTAELSKFLKSNKTQMENDK